MVKILSLHAFRGGTGKTNLIANLAAVLAAQGKRVALVDGDFQAPGLPALWGLDEQSVSQTLNAYLWEAGDLKPAVYEVTPAAFAAGSGQIFLVPSSLKLGDIARIGREGYPVSRLHQGLQQLAQDFSLDYLLIDTAPGIAAETLLTLATSHELIIVLRPDRQDFQGTAITLQAVRHLNLAQVSLIVNKLLPKYDPEAVQQQVAAKFAVPVLGILPMVEDLMDWGSQGIFALAFPQHSYTTALQRMATAIAERL